MGKYAVIKHNMVENIIVLNEGQIEEFEGILGAEIIDAIPFGLCIGDMRVGENWTRNLNGVQTVLEPLDPDQQTDYKNLRDDLEYKTEIINALEEAFVEGVESIG